MSFGDPNNPYGPPQGQQPGYGQPQGQQPGYGYPAAPPVSPYGAYPGGPAPYGAPMPMPGTVKAARVMLWIMGILQILAGIGVALAGGALVNNSSLDGDTASVATGVFVIIGLVALALGVWGVVIAAKCGSGGNGIRISGIVYGSLVTAGGLANLASGQSASVVALVLGILIIVFFSKADAAAWFKRPRF